MGAIHVLHRASTFVFLYFCDIRSTNLCLCVLFVFGEVYNRQRLEMGVTCYMELAVGARGQKRQQLVHNHHQPTLMLLPPTF